MDPTKAVLERNGLRDCITTGLVSKCPRCGGKGKNNLGKILMKIREEIRTQKKGLKHG